MLYLRRRWSHPNRCINSSLSVSASTLQRLATFAHQSLLAQTGIRGTRASTAGVSRYVDGSSRCYQLMVHPFIFLIAGPMRPYRRAGMAIAHVKTRSGTNAVQEEPDRAGAIPHVQQLYTQQGNFRLPTLEIGPFPLESLGFAGILGTGVFSFFPFFFF
ncbi:hypothetical protein BDV95DRAFT_20592 [Massariosphaeria phaeospora]|uniref:Uncharacterized protein n=1 Tax=Massariosphaeria phaeospora TaxID=100035 RepID=A0A7C8IFW6_9PLEO|nr:hypothetical protein BDV95DRAFT_20592 [Massariosphaeria phaeospora]